MTLKKSIQQNTKKKTMKNKTIKNKTMKNKTMKNKTVKSGKTLKSTIKKTQLKNKSASRFQIKKKESELESLTFSQIVDFIESKGPDVFLKKAMKDLQSIEYPYQTIFHSKKELLEFSKKIVKYRPIIEHKTAHYPNLLFKTPIGDKTIFNIFLKDSYQYDRMLEYFSENCVRFCQRYDQDENPHQLWQHPEYKQKIIEYILEKQLDWSIQSIKEAHYELAYNVYHYGCSYFKITLMLTFLRHFQPKRVLDMSSGWGDRLMGCLLYGCEYTGFDPSNCMYSNYQNMIETFNAQGRCRVNKMGFEKSPSILKKDDIYDVVITGPPFFDLEIYEKNSPTQSMELFNTFDTWLVFFLFRSLAILWQHIKEGGHMLLYINDFNDRVRGHDFKYCESVILFCVNYLPNCKYLGIIGQHSSGKSMKPSFVFEKSGTDKVQIQYLLKKYYPVWGKMVEDNIKTMEIQNPPVYYSYHNMNRITKTKTIKPKTIKPKTIKTKTIKLKTIKPKTIKPKIIKPKTIKPKTIQNK
jgi:hypothetical protein